MTGRDDKPKSQIERFKEAARELGTDEGEAAFDEKLRRIAKAPSPRPARPSKGLSRSEKK